MDRKTVRILNILIILSVVVFIGTSLLSLINFYQIASSIQISDIKPTTVENKLGLSTIFKASNPGFFPADFSLTVEYEDTFENTISTNPIKIHVPAYTLSYSQPINLEIDLSNLKQENILNLGKNFGNITLKTSLSASIGNILILNSSLDVSTTWSPPIHQLQINTPHIIKFNSTHIGIISEYSFENLSPFLDASGSVNINVYDKKNDFVGKGIVDIIAKPNTNSSGEVSVEVKLPYDTEYMLFNDVQMNYTAIGVLSAESIGSRLLNISWPFIVDWGAPVKDPVLTETMFLPYNSTHSIYTSTLSATNSNDYLTLQGRLRATILNGTTVISTSEYQPFLSQPKTSNNWNLQMIVPNNIITIPKPILQVELDTNYKKFIWEAPILG